MSIRKFAGRTALILVLAVSTVPFAASASYAASSHSEQADGSDHGNSNKPARQDPQPTKGKDCLPHGKWGGINEDHCAGRIEL